MKKLICLLLVLVLAFSLVACNDDEDKDKETPDVPGEVVPMPEIPNTGNGGVDLPVIPVN